jgi:hypothetical protein
MRNRISDKTSLLLSSGGLRAVTVAALGLLARRPEYSGPRALHPTPKRKSGRLSGRTRTRSSGERPLILSRRHDPHVLAAALCKASAMSALLKGFGRRPLHDGWGSRRGPASESLARRKPRGGRALFGGARPMGISRSPADRMRRRAARRRAVVTGPATKTSLFGREHVRDWR